MTTAATGYVGRHRGDAERRETLHCCIGGCATRACPGCHEPVCVSIGLLHFCRRPYAPRHAREDHAARPTPPKG